MRFQCKSEHTKSVLYRVSNGSNSEDRDSYTKQDDHCIFGLCNIILWSNAAPRILIYFYNYTMDSVV